MFQAEKKGWVIKFKADLTSVLELNSPKQLSSAVMRAFIRRISTSSVPPVISLFQAVVEREGIKQEIDGVSKPYKPTNPDDLKQVCDSLDANIPNPTYHLDPRLARELEHSIGFSAEEMATMKPSSILQYASAVAFTMNNMTEMHNKYTEFNVQEWVSPEELMESTSDLKGFMQVLSGMAKEIIQEKIQQEVTKEVTYTAATAAPETPSFKSRFRDLFSSSSPPSTPSSTASSTASTTPSPPSTSSDNEDKTQLGRR